VDFDNNAFFGEVLDVTPDGFFGHIQQAGEFSRAARPTVFTQNPKEFMRTVRRIYFSGAAQFMPILLIACGKPQFLNDVEGF
jgi:hypothetical protein